MRNHSLLLWVLLLLYGVYGADVGTVKLVSVMKGDSVTLHTGVTELQKDDKIEWMSKNFIIAQIENNKTSIHEDGLKLDYQTGSLTIRNIAENRLYELHIRGDQLISSTFNVTVHDEVVSVSVIERDSVTLHTGVTKIQKDDKIVWKFGEQGKLIADLNGPVDTSWKNIHLNHQTGDLTIRNIQIDQSGDYKVEINNISMILHRKFYMAVDEVKTVSVKKGDSFVLRTGVLDIQEYDQISWKFGGGLIGEIKKGANRFSLFSAGRFEGRLQPYEKTGSLTISESRITDSGDYQLHMISSTHTIQRNVGVTVTDSRNSGAVSGICSASVGMVVWAVTVFLLQEV